MSQERPAAGGESCRQNPFYTKQITLYQERMKIMTENKCMTANQEENAVAEKNRKKVKIHVREMTFIAMMFRYHCCRHFYLLTYHQLLK